ncbi:hypothetical protein GWK47_019013 [Chionoecetes opilio]|uniref:Endonuclease/exonuclease/phosphatase domain-containing protein n=1 Tax=Chionoecetes opilio TaxID=41210 RepID=A0A8J4XR51_CHIOP|nr:hypothetical protein GWK47_019013 [Chionoecetes opilio]
MNVINLYVSSNCFGVTALPDPIFQGVMTLVAGDLNARHRSLESGGKTNVNGTRLVQFLSDFPQARLLGSQEATHIQGGRLDYACLVNYQGATGISNVISDLLSDHFAIGIRLPLTKRKVHCDRKRLSLPKDKVDHFISKISLWYDNYRPTCIDKFYRDMVCAIETVLCDNQHAAKQRYTRSRAKQYSNDKVLQGHSRMLRVAHKNGRIWTGCCYQGHTPRDS